MKTFKDILAWQKGYELGLLIYKVTANFPKCEEFGLKSQLRRAAVSVISNIAEGFKRKGYKEKIRFYNQSQSSLEEIKCQILFSRDLGYISLSDSRKIEELADRTGRILHGWIESQKSTES